MFLLFQGINLVILFLILVIPIVGTYYLIKHLKNKESNKDEILGRILLLEKRVKEIEDYIKDSE
ncbi:hypothetical protein [Tepidibacter thalassicus]|uniref:Uncharacterized protein n=1 Tax=Tepidibacter thalassicus DSM 15285 TaxID=1123350 RepID=A0A1M5T725_9FIRM|nr:hypothetical protein [Tepidibacter thalassicus]SHH46516.1 hypothetical protein SAMN02744040_02056 [Tepidibacter thalassicus DSM 15285]